MNGVFYKLDKGFVCRCWEEVCWCLLPPRRFIRAESLGCVLMPLVSHVMVTASTLSVVNSSCTDLVMFVPPPVEYVSGEMVSTSPYSSGLLSLFSHTLMYTWSRLVDVNPRISVTCPK